MSHSTTSFEQPRIRGKFLCLGEDKFYVKGTCPSPKTGSHKNLAKSKVDTPGATATDVHSKREKPTNVELEVRGDFDIVLMSFRYLHRKTHVSSWHRHGGLGLAQQYIRHCYRQTEHPPVLRQNWIRQRISRNLRQSALRTHGRKTSTRSRKSDKCGARSQGRRPLSYTDELAALHRKTHRSSRHSMAHSD